MGLHYAFISGFNKQTFMAKSFFITWLHRVLVAAHEIFVAACGLLSSCSTRALERAGSVVVVHRLSCPMACGMLVPLD